MNHLHLTTENDAAVITFDREGSRANLFDRETFAELNAALDTLGRAAPPRGLIFRSAKPSIFIAGADLNLLANARGDELRDLIELGQNIFTRISKLPFPVVAAIHGACVGGGYELALACDWRVASKDPSTKIGLPETSLGVLPAWGGTTRLTRLIGLPAALGLILAGKVLSPGAAKAKGLVDALVPQENLESFAKTFISRGKRRVKSHPHLHNPLATRFIRWKAGKGLLEKTRGLYPAPPAALEVAAASATGPLQAGFDREKEAVIRLAERPETKQLMRVFFLQERAKKFRPNDAEPGEIKRCAVIGAGVMGAGIAYWLSARGRHVILRDLDDDALARGMKSIAKWYDESRSRRILTPVEAARGMDRILPSATAVPLHHCDLVIEAALERIDIKRTIFADLSARTRPDAILATNTSALPVTDLAAVIGNPDRLIGLHFFNPVHRMPLVEVVRTEQTSDQTLATAVAFVRSIGKTPVVVRDSPGFLVNRILMPYLVEASKLFEQGGDPETIDNAMLDFGMPMGPLRLLDEVGLDVALHVATSLSTAFPERMEIPALLTKLVEQEKLGRKSGAGFFIYGKRRISPDPAALRLRTGSTPAPTDTATRLARLMSAEARLCLEEKVAATADEIDLAMILGTGYAPFHGGPLQYAKNHPS